ncbi:hypothetical protein LTR17_009222 [Elasticomyces elasticus]|nr:hypothetical protein LTR17_009222 [Elasticomyces elasticus]
MQTSSTAMRTMRSGFFRRAFTTIPAARSAWTPGPAPPRLPKEEQEIFDKLQEQSTGAFSQPKEAPAAQNNTKASAESDLLDSAPPPNRLQQLKDMMEQRARVEAKGNGEELHPNVRRGAPPEFEGDVNPKTGEVGGPKNDPIRWGASAACRRGRPVRHVSCGHLFGSPDVRASNSSRNISPSIAQPTKVTVSDLVKPPAESQKPGRSISDLAMPAH